MPVPMLATPVEGGSLGVPIMISRPSAVRVASPGRQEPRRSQPARLVRRSTSAETPRAAMRTLMAIDPLSKTAREEPPYADVFLHSPVVPVRPAVDTQFPRQPLGTFSPKVATVSPAPPPRAMCPASGPTLALQAQITDAVLEDIATRQRELQDTVDRLASQMEDISSTFREFTQEGVRETVYSPTLHRQEAVRRLEDCAVEVTSCERQSSRNSATPSGSALSPPEVTVRVSEDTSTAAAGVEDLRQAMRTLQQHNASLENRNIRLEARNKCLEEALCELCRRVTTLEDSMHRSPATSPRAGAVRLPPRHARHSTGSVASTPTPSEVRAVSDAAVTLRTQ
uniref:Uncharacterized protein n=1 Tax=Alexandrium catenella TaxID=2925 RepID=A0A7S1RHV3_ALECA|mmetsp:Transcript_58349/g.156146  ORF Transcript_58349/g.156146 Transcript_58349/m.156146 type:complete len:340 (+) Transcript_58349:77-1096(+)